MGNHNQFITPTSETGTFKPLVSPTPELGSVVEVKRFFSKEAVGEIKSNVAGGTSDDGSVHQSQQRSNRDKYKRTKSIAVVLHNKQQEHKNHQ